MNKLDSDLLGALFAFFTFLLPVFSAILEKRRKKGKGIAEPYPEEGEEYADAVVEMEEMEEQAEAAAEISVVEPVAVAQVEKFEEPVAEPVAVARIEKVEEPVAEPVAVHIAKKLRDNPKDMVIFAEILNPKFKEY